MWARSSSFAGTGSSWWRQASAAAAAGQRATPATRPAVLPPIGTIALILSQAPGSWQPAAQACGLGHCIHWPPLVGPFIAVWQLRMPPMCSPSAAATHPGSAWCCVALGVATSAARTPVRVSKRCEKSGASVERGDLASGQKGEPQRRRGCRCARHQDTQAIRQANILSIFLFPC